MLNSKIKLVENMQFVGEADSGHAVVMDAASPVGGNNTGSRPSELLLMAFGGCSGMDVISILQKKRQQVSAFEVAVSADQSEEHPKVFTSMNIHYSLRGSNIDPKAVERAIELSETKYCPAQAMFNQILPVQLRYTIEND